MVGEIRMLVSNKMIVSAYFQSHTDKLYLSVVTRLVKSGDELIGNYTWGGITTGAKSIIKGIEVALDAAHAAKES